MNFEEIYGTLGHKFIHVHHVNPSNKENNSIDPMVDLAPLCPNCHAMAHRRNPPIGIEELKQILD